MAVLLLVTGCDSSDSASDGIIVTNAHVIAGHEEVVVAFADGKRSPARVVAVDRVVDLALLDAAISPGNSGGALVNGRGEVVGINVAYIPPQARAVSIGFAIPAPTVVDVVPQLIEDGVATHPFIGIQPAAVTAPIAERLGLERREGVLVLDVTPGGPAEEAGVEPGDVIVGLADDGVATVEQFLAQLRNLETDQRVALTVVRDGVERVLQIEIGERPAP